MRAEFQIGIVVVLGELAAIYLAWRFSVRRNRNAAGWVLAAILVNWAAVFALALSSYNFGEWSPRAFCRDCHLPQLARVVRPGGAFWNTLMFALGPLTAIAYAIWNKYREQIVCGDCGSDDVFLIPAPDCALMFPPEPIPVPQPTVQRI